MQSVAAVADMYLPVGQAEQDATPTVAVLLYFPAAQSPHEAELAVDVFPETQEVQMLAPPTE